MTRRNTSAILPSVRRAVVMSQGAVDFDCPHVDAHNSVYKRPLLSHWRLTPNKEDDLTLIKLVDLAGQPVSPIRPLPETMRLDDMVERSDTSNNIALLFMFFLKITAEEQKGAGAYLHGLDILCTADLVAVDWITDEIRLRPRLRNSRLRIPSADADDRLMLLFDRHGQDELPSNHHILPRLTALAPQIEAISRTIAAPGEQFAHHPVIAC